MRKSVGSGKILRGALLVSGTTIGAGMLGLPLVTAPAGFIPGLCVTTLVWLFMLATGLLFLESTLWCPDGSNVLTIARTYLGKTGQRFSGALFLFLYYSLMIAYLAAGKELFFQLLQGSLSATDALFVFTAIFVIIVAIGPRSIDRANIILSCGMVAAWAFLIGAGSGEVTSARLGVFDWGALPFAAPVIFSAFGFHNIIPSLSTYLQRDKKSLKLAIVFGTLIPLIIYVLWQFLIIGAIPQETIATYEHSGKPITGALASFAGRPEVLLFGQAFGFFALVTSILGVSFSMVDFLADGLRANRYGPFRFVLTILTFVPPFVFAYAIPGVFTQALGIAGGFGEAFLNGLLPIALVYIGRNMHKEKPIIGFFGSTTMLLLLLLLCLGVIVLECFNLYADFFA